MFFGRLFHSNGQANKLEDHKQELVMYKKKRELYFTFNWLKKGYTPETSVSSVQRLLRSL